MSKTIQKTAVAFGLAALAAGSASAGFLTSEPAQMNRSANTEGLWKVLPAWTVGEDFGGYYPPGIPDGMGAFALNETTVRLLVNHELGATAGYAHSLDNGTMLTGGRVSYFDFNKGNRQIDGAGLAYGMIIDRYGNVVTDGSQIAESDVPTTDGLDRPCSANYFGAGEYGLVDDIFFTGEETGGGQEFALDPTTNILHCVPAMGRAAWESCTLVEPPSENQIAAIVGDDRQAAPLLLYVGEKDYYNDGSFLDRNGLAYGRLYVWVEDNGAGSPEDWNGTFNTTTGTFVEIPYYQPDMAGQPGFDDAGWADQSTQDQMAADAGAFQFSRPEDVHTNPDNDLEFVMASTGRGGAFPSDNWGTTYIFEVGYGEAISAAVEIIYDGDDAGAGQFTHPDFGLRSPDNLEWGMNGKIYLQEDRSTSPGSLFGGTSGVEASAWELDPNTGDLTRILEMDRNAVPSGQTDTDPTDLGDWESSGVIDVTDLFDSRPFENIFLLNTQAHSLRGGNIDSEDLAQGGQIFFATIQNGPSFENVGSIWSIEADFATQLQLQVGPNPNAGNTTVAFQLPQADDVQVTVYDASGRSVRSLASGEFAGGSHNLQWDGLNASGNEVQAGVYFIRVATSSGVAQEKINIVR